MNDLITNIVECCLQNIGEQRITVGWRKQGQAKMGRGGDCTELVRVGKKSARIVVVVVVM